MVMLRSDLQPIVKDTKALSDLNRKGNNTYRVAIDMGTTTISWKLCTPQGEILASFTQDNIQTSYGSDVMMRLMHYCQRPDIPLTTMIRKQLEDGIHVLLDKQFLPSQIEQIIIVGNTAMCQIFLGLDCQGLTGAPFTPSYDGSIRKKGIDLDFLNYSQTEIIVLPRIAAHVGADAAAVLCACQLQEQDSVDLVVDIGTNAEILLNDHGKIFACSTAAGPAFEGRGFACGCRAKKGAISSVTMNKANGIIILDVLGLDTTCVEFSLQGLCGSGLLDAIAQLCRIGIVQEDGYMLSVKEAEQRNIHPDFVKRIGQMDGQRVFWLFHPQLDVALSYPKPIYICQEDIRNLQLAKSAIITGIQCLLSEIGLQNDEMDHLMLAGAFGSHLSISNMIRIGLLPELPKDKFLLLGNAAMEGAIHVLRDNATLDTLEKQVKLIHHVELSQKELFSKKYMDNMILQPIS